MSGLRDALLVVAVGAGSVAAVVGLLVVMGRWGAYVLIVGVAGMVVAIVVGVGTEIVQGDPPTWVRYLTAGSMGAVFLGLLNDDLLADERKRAEN